MIKPCLLSMLVFTASSAFAQEDRDMELVQGFGSRIEKPDNTVELKVETEVTSTIITPAFSITPCQAELSADYYQSHTLARVEIRIANPSCPAGSGTFTVDISTRADEGDMQRLSYPETWERSETAVLDLEKEYPIGENVRLVSVRLGNVRCTCETLVTE